MSRPTTAIAVLVTLAALGQAPVATRVHAQGPPRGPRIVSPEVHADRRVTLRLLAPRADTVRLTGEILDGGRPVALTRDSTGVWSVTIGPLAPDVYTYAFNVDGVNTPDPLIPYVKTVASSGLATQVEVPGDGPQYYDARPVPHRMVSIVQYDSKSLGVPRTAWVYTPPGYAQGSARYPVLYLLRGVGDADESWLMAGRANFILDNLIAAGKAKPMIVVMPAGHVPPPPGGGRAAPDAFARDFLTDVVPYVEKHYRTLPGREHRAIAGLSMGGQQTLNVGMTNLDKFSHLGVFSSGWFGQDGAATFARNNQAVLADPRLNDRLKLFWFATGNDDFVMPSTKTSLAMLDQHKVRYTYKETEGGHTWPNWRAYLNEFAPLLFR